MNEPSFRIFQNDKTLQTLTWNRKHGVRHWDGFTFIQWKETAKQMREHPELFANRLEEMKEGGEL